MESHEVIRQVLQNTSAKQIAADLGLSLSLVYKWTEPPSSTAGGGPTNPLLRADQLIQSTGDPEIIRWLCQRAGGFFVRNPKAHDGRPDQLMPATNHIVREFADLLSVISQASADNSISKPEADSIRARWEALKSVTESFVSHCERGNFGAAQGGAKVPQAG